MRTSLAAALVLLVHAPNVLAAAPAAPPPAAAPAARKPLACGKEVASRVAAAPKGDPETRLAAQRGLAFLASASQAWTQRNHCFGCHVQAVTVEAFAVGRHHRYEVPAGDVDGMVKALLMGVTAGGPTTGAAFEGQAWARYDQWIDGQRTSELVKYATQLMGLQRQDGSIPDDDARLPVTGGVMHTTYQGMQTWRQAYSRTADDKWLAPIRRAERYLAGQSAQWNGKSDVYIQNVNFALLGLVAAGVGPSEESSLRLQRLLLARQNQDGGWGLDHGRSDALATGQTLYALKLAGHTDGESAIARGAHWLTGKQGADGAWRTVHSGQGGAEKAEGMWAVLGLVSTDVMSVVVSGLSDGQHVGDTMAVAVEARDNRSAGGVRKVEVFVDDLPVDGACGPRLAWSWKAAALSEGKHVVDVVATNTRGEDTRRRLEVYAGNVFLTEVGARFDEGRQATEVTVRNIAPTADTAGKVELSVWSVDGADNKRKDRVFASEQKGAPGAMTWIWDGRGSDGKARPRGRYVAELTLRDARGRTIQKESTLFFHDSELEQKRKFAEIEGNLALRGGAGVAANTTVELVNDKGEVVQSVRSTEQGNYRFKSVAAGKYHVRASKAGWDAQEAPVEATPAAAPAKADMKF
jgi:squalene-hopene/tetraprenyl-beta-curcumene cyclase